MDQTILPQNRRFGLGKILLVASVLITFAGAAAVFSYEGPHVGAIRELNDCGAKVVSFVPYQDRPPVYGHWQRYELWVARDSYSVSFGEGTLGGPEVLYVSMPSAGARPFAEEDLAILQGLPTTQYLELENQNISDEGFAHLSAHPGLVVLSICGTQIGDRSLDVIASIPRLKYLLADSKMFSKPALARLRAARPDLWIDLESRGDR